MAEGHAGDGAPQLRVGDAERRAAMQALDAHLEAGRLSVDEYGDRSAAAVGAVHRDDLAALFVDLPAPHPPLPRRPGEPVAVAAPVAGVVVPAGRSRRPVRPAAGLALGLAIVVLCSLPAIAGALLAGAVPVGGFVLLVPLLFLALSGIPRHHDHGGDEGDGGPGTR